MRMQSRSKAILLMIASLFVHEMALFTTLPVYLAYCAYQGKSMRSVMKMAGLALSVFALIYLFLQTSSTASLTQFLEQAGRLANYGVRVDYYDVFRLSFVGGWDYSRWLFLSLASSILCLFIARAHLGWRLLLCLVIGCFALPTVGFLDYFDRFTPRFAPWYQWPYFYEVDLWNLLRNIPSR